MSKDFATRDLRFRQKVSSPLSDLLGLLLGQERRVLPQLLLGALLLPAHLVKQLLVISTLPGSLALLNERIETGK